MYYTKSEEESHQELIDALFCTGPLLSAAQQRETFQNALTSCLNESCSYDVVQGVHEQLRERFEQHKESKDPAPLDLSVRDMGAMLRESGVAEEQIQAFEETCLADFGEGAVLSPGNLMDSKQVKVERRCSCACPDRDSLVEARLVSWSHCCRCRRGHRQRYLIHFPEETDAGPCAWAGAKQPRLCAADRSPATNQITVDHHRQLCPVRLPGAPARLRPGPRQDALCHGPDTASWPRGKLGCRRHKGIRKPAG